MKTLILIAFLFSACSLYSQNYTRSVGVRGGGNPAITYRMFMNEEDSYEFYLARIPSGMSVSVLKQHFVPRSMGLSDNLFFGYGFGAHIGFNYTNTYDYLFATYYLKRKLFAPIFGFDGYVGLEYRAREFPVVFGLDAKPYFEFSTVRIFKLNILNAAFTIKYRF